MRIRPHEYVEASSGLGEPRHIEDWTLFIGFTVEIYEAGLVRDRGKIHDATKDGSILWLAQDGASPRRIWEILPGRYVGIIPTM